MSFVLKTGKHTAKFRSHERLQGAIELALQRQERPTIIVPRDDPAAYAAIMRAYAEVGRPMRLHRTESDVQAIDYVLAMLKDGAAYGAGAGTGAAPIAAAVGGKTVTIGKWVILFPEPTSIIIAAVGAGAAFGFAWAIRRMRSVATTVRFSSDYQEDSPVPNNPVPTLTFAPVRT